MNIFINRNALMYITDYFSNQFIINLVVYEIFKIFTHFHQSNFHLWNICNIIVKKLD